MFAVETYAAVRRFVFVEGKSRREAARVFGLSRETVAKMCRYSVPHGYVRTKEPEKPTLGPLVPVIDAILDADKTAPPKQRHTAKRIFERLRIEHGFLGGYTKGISFRVWSACGPAGLPVWFRLVSGVEFFRVISCSITSGSFGPCGLARQKRASSILRRFARLKKWLRKSTTSKPMSRQCTLLKA